MEILEDNQAHEQIRPLTYTVSHSLIQNLCVLNITHRSVDSEPR